MAIYGSDLANLVNLSLGGYQNAIDGTLMFSVLNEAKNELWMKLKEEKVNYFGVQSQNTQPTAPFYFPPLTTNARAFPLPSDFHEMRLLEVTDVGYEGTIFEWRSMSSVDFQTSRRASTNNPAPDTTTGYTYYWDVVGANTLVLAQFPAIPFNLIIWYIRFLPDFTAEDLLQEILYPYIQKLAEYATMKLMLALQDLPLNEEWRKQWRESLISVESSAAARQSSSPVFVTDFLGYPIEN